jgi:hypothetical protein
MRINRTVLAAAVLTVAASVASAGVVADYPLADASGYLKDTTPAHRLSTTTDLPAPADYAQPGPPAGAYGSVTLTADDAASLKSARFDGKTKLNLGPAKDSPINLTGDFSVTAWAKFDKTDGYHMILATGAGSGNGWKFGINDGNPTFTANGVADASVDDTTIDAGKWTFLAVTVSGKTGERTITFYVNGKKAGEAQTADDIKPSDVEQMHLGGADNASDTDENFEGNLSQLRVYDTVLKPDEVKAEATKISK